PPYAGLANRCLQPLGHLSLGLHDAITTMLAPRTGSPGPRESRPAERASPGHAGHENNLHRRDERQRATRPYPNNYLTLISFQSTCGGGGIRTPGACARRFSRPLPSTARPLLRASPEVGGQYRDRRSLVKPDPRTSTRSHPQTHALGTSRSRPPMYGCSAAG